MKFPQFIFIGLLIFGIAIIGLSFSLFFNLFNFVEEELVVPVEASLEEVEKVEEIKAEVVVEEVVEEIKELPGIELDLSHLSEKAQGIVNEWQDIDLQDFTCEKLDDSTLSFLFVPSGYSDLDINPEERMDFELYSQQYAWAVSQDEPFKSYKEKSKYYKYNGPVVSVHNIVGDLEENCQMTIENRPVLVSVIKSDRGGASANLRQGTVHGKNPGYKKMIENDKTSFINYHNQPTHELGHAFAGFLDEYTFVGKEEWVWPVDEYEYYENGVRKSLGNFETPFNKGKKVPSCPSLKEAKEMWGDLVDSEMSLAEPDDFQIGYYPGCYNYSNRYKPTKVSLMGTSRRFNLVQKRFLCELLIDRTDVVLGECNKFFQ